MAIGFPASHEEERRFSVPYEHLLEAIRDTFEVLEWSHEEPSPGDFLVKRGLSMTSYGERIEVQAFEDGVVHVKSRCAWPLQIIDWGKNRANTSEFLAGLARLLQG